MAHHGSGPIEPEPGEMDEGCAEQRDEQPVAARGRNAQHADALRLRTTDREQPS